MKMINTLAECLPAFVVYWCVAVTSVEVHAAELTTAQAKEVEKSGMSWEQIESEKRLKGLQWKEPTTSEEGDWVPIVLTESQREELRIWIKREIDLQKQAKQRKMERQEAVQSGDKGKVRLIDGINIETQGRFKLPLNEPDSTKWDAILKEQNRRGLEWHEEPKESGRRARGRWKQKTEEAENDPSGSR